MIESKIILLTNQTFEEQGGEKVFPNLSIGKILVAEGEGTTETLANFYARLNLMNKALKEEYTHVFSVEYSPFKTESRKFNCQASGVGYKLRE